MPAQREEDEAKIKQQVDKIVAGIRAKDLEGLRRLYATDVVVRGTFCFRKLEHNWLIVHDQVSVPFDIVSGQGVTDLEP